MDNYQNVNLVWWFWSPHFLLHRRMFSCFHSWIKVSIETSTASSFSCFKHCMEINLHPRFETGALSTVCSSVEDGWRVWYRNRCSIPWHLAWTRLFSYLPLRNTPLYQRNVQRTFLKGLLVTMVVLARPREQDTPEYKFCLSFFRLGDV